MNIWSLPIIHVLMHTADKDLFKAGLFQGSPRYVLLASPMFSYLSTYFIKYGNISLNKIATGYIVDSMGT